MKCIAKNRTHRSLIFSELKQNHRVCQYSIGASGWAIFLWFCIVGFFLEWSFKTW